MPILDHCKYKIKISRLFFRSAIDIRYTCMNLYYIQSVEMLFKIGREVRIENIEKHTRTSCNICYSKNIYISKQTSCAFWLILALFFFYCVSSYLHLFCVHFQNFQFAHYHLSVVDFIFMNDGKIH